MKSINLVWQKGGLLFLLLPMSALAQDLTGIWKGYFITKDFNQYKVEFQLKHTAQKLTGVSYSYLTTIYYGKAAMTGQFNKSNTISIQETKTIEVTSTNGGGTCLMNFSLMYTQSGREEYLEGTFTSKYESQTDEAKKGEDCGDGRIYLRKVMSSDFKPEPFLQNTTAKKVINNEAPVKRALLPPTEKQRQSTSATLSPSQLEDGTTLQKSSLSSTTQGQIRSVMAAKDPIPIPMVSNNRINNLLKELTVTDPRVTVSLYDNGEVDGDTVSVYLNNKIVLFQKRLNATPLQFSLLLDKTNNLQEITVVADNLGRIPPNSALMIVEAGEQQFRVQITSTEQKNAVVRFRYDPPKP